MTDEEIRQTMCGVKNIHEWNDMRDKMKAIRNTAWISRHLDQSGLIKTIDLKPIDDISSEQPTNTKEKSMMTHAEFRKKMALDNEDLYQWYLSCRYVQTTYF